MIFRILTICTILLLIQPVGANDLKQWFSEPVELESPWITTRNEFGYEIKGISDLNNDGLPEIRLVDAMDELIVTCDQIKCWVVIFLDRKKSNQYDVIDVNLDGFKDLFVKNIKDGKTDYYVLLNNGKNEFEKINDIQKFPILAKMDKKRIMKVLDLTGDHKDEYVLFDAKSKKMMIIDSVLNEIEISMEEYLGKNEHIQVNTLHYDNDKKLELIVLIENKHEGDALIIKYVEGNYIVEKENVSWMFYGMTNYLFDVVINEANPFVINTATLITQFSKNENKVLTSSTNLVDANQYNSDVYANDERNLYFDLNHDGWLDKIGFAHKDQGLEKISVQYANPQLINAHVK